VSTPPVFTPLPAFVVTRSPIANKDLTASWEFIKILQTWANQINTSLNQIGQFIGTLAQSTVVVGKTTLGNLFANVDNSGVITANGVDFARPYLNKNTDHINDGVGSPLAGGRQAFSALVASGPVANRALVYNGTNWVPSQIQYNQVGGTPVVPQNTPATGSLWFNSYNASTGNFTALQPAFTNIAGQITNAQMPPGGITGTITLAKLTVGGTNGSITVVNGQVTGVVNPT
jgi:hypothetical protein